MKISLFNEHITIEKNTVLVDKVGNHRSVWKKYFSCHAYAAATTYKEDEKEAAGQTVSDETLTFTVRYCRELLVLTPANYRIRFHDAVYNIRSVDMMNYQRESIKIRTTRERRE